MSNEDAEEKTAEGRDAGSSAAADKAETLGGDLEQTEQASAQEIEQLVKASVRADDAAPRAIDDADTATGDPDAIERGILASKGDGDGPPSSDAMPLSARDVEPTSGRVEGPPVELREAEDEPLSLRDVEPEAVSMRDVEIAMAPGKAPPKLPVRPPPIPAASNVTAPAARAVPRAPLKKRPAPTEGDEDASAPSPPPPPPNRSSNPPPARTPSVPPPLPTRSASVPPPVPTRTASVPPPVPTRTASVPPPVPKRPSSIPPPLPPAPVRADREDEEIQSLHGGLSLGMPPAPTGLGPPMSIEPEPESMGPDSLDGPVSQPAKKKKKKKRKSIAFDEPVREAAKEGGTLGLAVSPSAARVRVTKTTRSSGDLASGDLASEDRASEDRASEDDAVSARAGSDPPAPLAPAARTAAKPAPSPATTPTKKRVERPIAPPPPAPAESSTGSKMMWAVGGAAIALIVGYVAFGRPSQPTQTEARSQEQHAAVGPAPTPTEPKPAETTKTEEPAPTPVDTASAEPPPAPAPSASVVQVASAPVPSAVGSVPPAPTTAPPAPTTAGTTPPAPTAPPAPTTPPTPTAEPSAAPPTGGAEFDRAAASAALNSAVGAASGCKKEGDPSGTARVSVTFAPSGRVTVANIMGPPFAGTATGGCIAMSFRSASVPPFEGNPVTVTKTVNIP